LKWIDDLNTKLALLVKKVESLELKKVHVVSEQQEKSCVMCESKGHMITMLGFPKHMDIMETINLNFFLESQRFC
jgi:hypothetical protein